MTTKTTRSADPYQWLENLDNANTQSFIKTEQEKTKQYIEAHKTLINELYNEALEKIQLADESVPYYYNGYYYYEKINKTDNYAQHFRKKLNIQQSPELLIDENTLASEHEFFDLGSAEISPDSKLLACATDTTGDEYYNITIKDCSKNNWLDDTVQGVSEDICWSADSRSFFYVCLDEQHRPYQIKQHRLGTKVDDDLVIFTEEDEKFTISIELSKSERYLFISCHSNVTTEIYYTPANKKELSFKSIKPRQQEIKYFVEEHDNCFYLLTNQDSKQYSMYKAHCSQHEALSWELIIPSKTNISLEDFELFKDYLVVAQRVTADVQLTVYSLNNMAPIRTLEFPDDVYSVEMIDNLDMNSNTMRYHYESLKDPASVWDYNLKTQQRKLLKQEQVLGHFNANDYTTARLLVKARDGTSIPLSLVYKKSTSAQFPAPLYLYGYGAYGHSNDPSFSYTRLSLLDRGFIYAIAHVRGGGDCGEIWHDQGRMKFKQNSFDDFADCAHYLIQNNYTESNKLTLSGGSAGGLLVGATLNQNPNLCRLAILHVPFVDALNTMMNKTLPLTIGEYEEWGNPEKPKEKKWIASYSPYDNIQTQNYPDCFITCGLEDYRVSYWEALKWGAKIQEKATNDPLMVFKINDNAGHAGDSGRFQHIKDIAIETAFILNRIKN